MAETLTFGSLFAGIGGFDIGLERAGMRCAWQVEIDSYATRVLEQHWPDVARWRDIREFQPSSQNTVDVICGGFPCQDISLAGPGTGLEGERSGLWTEFRRIIGCLRPRYVIVENVAALLRRGIDRVCGDLAQLGYGSEWQTFLASDFGLPHRRERIVIVAYPDEIVRRECEGVGLVTDGPQEVFGTGSTERAAVRVQTFDHLVGIDDGVSRQSYSDRASCVGNAVIPPAFEWVGRRIIAFDRELRRHLKSKLTGV